MHGDIVGGENIEADVYFLKYDEIEGRDDCIEGLDITLQLFS